MGKASRLVGSTIQAFQIISEAVLSAWVVILADQTINVGNTLTQWKGDVEYPAPWESPLPFDRRLLTGPWVGRSHQRADLVRAQRVGLPSQD